MQKKEKNYAFIDSQNLNLSIRKQGWVLDFGRFYIYLRDKYKIKKIFLFIGYVRGNESLYTYLQRIGYIVVFKPTLPEGKVKGNVDAELVLHAMIEYPNYNQAMIVSGDGDFYCLIEYLKENDKLFKILIPNPRRYSALLRKFRGYFVYIDNLRKKLENKKLTKQSDELFSERE